MTTTCQHWLCILMHLLSLCSTDSPYTIFSVLHLVFLPIHHRFYLLIHIHSNPSLLLLLINPPNASNKSVKALFIRDVSQSTVFGVGSHANIVLRCASCCICHSTPLFILYFLYITRNGALT